MKVMMIIAVWGLEMDFLSFRRAGIFCYYLDKFLFYVFTGILVCIYSSYLLHYLDFVGTRTVETSDSGAFVG